MGVINSWLDKDYHRSQLPNDVEKLKDIIDEFVPFLRELRQQNFLLQKQVEELQQQNVQLTRQNTQLQQRVNDLENQVALLKHSKFGKKSERMPPQSGSNGTFPSSKPEGPSGKHPGRHALPSHLPRVRIEHDLVDPDKVCHLCHGILTKIDEVVSEQLDVIPAQLQVKEHVRFKYACRHCYGCIKTANLPAQAIDKGLPSAPLLAHILVNKFADHLPFYRQQRWFSRQQCVISRSTLWNWEKNCAISLEPLVSCLKSELVAGDHLFSDDTPMPTLEKGLKRAKIGRMWVYTRRPTATQPALTVYDYTPDRKGEHPRAFLKDFEGYLQVDAYGGLDQLFIQKDKDSKVVEEVGCMAHVRRKFVDVITLDPSSIAQEFLKMIQDLYRIDRLIQEAGYSDEQRKWLRRKRSKPILKKMYRWLKTNQLVVTPKSTLGRAIGYALNHWRALTTFLGDGRLELDNNRSERGIKPIVIGRKNFLFMGGPKGGWAAAIIFSLIESCKQSNIDPYYYLADVLQRLPTHSNKHIQELLPHHWKPPQTLQLAA
ncbi:MAG: IS66 family transposase [Parachlamydiaceae bacterium]